MIQNEHLDSWSKKSWLDELSKDVRLAKDLTSIYADDVIQSIEEKEYNNLDDAIAALKDRVNLTTAEVKNIREVVATKTEPEVIMVEQNIKKLSKKDLGELLKMATTPCEKCNNAPCDCAQSISTVVARAINKIGLAVLAESYDAMKDTVVTVDAAAEAVARQEAEVTSTAAVELTKEASTLRDLMSEGATAAEALDKVAKGMNPGFRAYLDKKKKEKGGGDKKDDKKEEGETSKKEDEKEVEASLKAKVEKWADYLGKQGYFQGADEPSHEGAITSNDPKTLGFGSKDGIEYPRPPMATTAPGGEDSRPAEQKSFEGAATEQAKNFLPGGKDEDLKEKWQRARYMGFVKKLKTGAKK